MTYPVSAPIGAATALLLKATLTGGAATLATLALAPSASALTVTQTQTLSLEGASFTDPNKTSATSLGELSFNKFNTSLGTLQQINFSGLGDLGGEITIRRTGNVPSGLKLNTTTGVFALTWTDDFNAFDQLTVTKNTTLCTGGTVSSPCSTTIPVNEVPISLSGSTTDSSLLSLFSGLGTISASLNYLLTLAYNSPNIASVQGVNYDNAFVDYRVTLDYIYEKDGGGGQENPDPSPDPDPVPGPVPLAGAALAFGWSRRLRTRIQCPSRYHLG